MHHCEQAVGIPKNQMRDTRFPAFVYDKQHDFKIQNSVNRTPVEISHYPTAHCSR
jgi:hypothetical protein